MVRSTEGAFGIHDPLVSMALADEIAEVTGSVLSFHADKEPQLTGFESRPQGVDKLAAKHFPEYLHWQEEVATWPHPVCAIRRDAAFRDHAVNVRMMLEFLVPGVEHAEEADFGAEVARVARHLKQRLSAGLQQQPIDHLLVEQCQGRQFMRQRKHYMHVTHRQEFGTACFDPSVTGVGLTLRAMAVAARVVGDGAQPAPRAFIHMTA